MVEMEVEASSRTTTSVGNCCACCAVAQTDCQWPMGGKGTSCDACMCVKQCCEHSGDVKVVKQRKVMEALEDRKVQKWMKETTVASEASESKSVVGSSCTQMMEFVEEISLGVRGDGDDHDEGVVRDMGGHKGGGCNHVADGVEPMEVA